MNYTNKPPIAKKVEKKLKKHRHTRIDNYYWLNNKRNSEVISYLNAENEYFNKTFSDYEELKNKLTEELNSRIVKDEISTPYLENGYYYYSKYFGDSEHKIFYRKKENLENEEELLLDLNKLAKNTDFFDFGGYNISEDNNLLAYSYDLKGNKDFIIEIKDLQTGKKLKEKIKKCNGDIVWANDNKTIFYILREKKTLRDFKIMKHILRTNQKEDTEIFVENDEEFWLGIDKSKSKKYIFLCSENSLIKEYSYFSADNPNEKPKIFVSRNKKIEYDIEHVEDKFFILTNYNAPNYRIMWTSEQQKSLKNWGEIVGHDEKILIENFEIFKDYIVVEERFNGMLRFQIINLLTNEKHFVDFQEETFTIWTSYNPEYETDTFRFGYSSLTTPISTYDYNLKTREKKLVRQKQVLGNFTAKNYETKRIFAEINSEIKIPISIVYKKGLEQNGQNPALITGYGAYGLSMDTFFDSNILSLLDRGLVYAIAHVRGGEEFGTKWYDDGKMLNKMNTFTDFIACCEFLISEKYTCSEKLFAEGGSAGGLLVTAVANMRPDLFKGIIAQVPFVDIVTTMLDRNIPLTTNEYDEWGNPENIEYYKYMLLYSPYDNIKKQKYPTMLITCGLNDTQVQYWEAAKYVAKLRDFKTDNNLLLLWTNMNAGHDGETGRFQQSKEIALEYTFIFILLNIKDL